jgi:hypothetical protein
MRTKLLLFVLSLSIFSVQSQKKIAYITDPAQATYANDTRILPMLKADTKFAVTEITATTSGQDLSSYDLVVIAEPAGSAAPMVLACKSLNKPILNMKVFAYKTGTTTWAWATANTDIVDNTTSQNVLVKKPNHAIFKGLNLTSGATLQLVTTPSGTKGINGLTKYANVVGTPDTLATIKDATTGLDAATGQLCIMEFPVGCSIAGTTIQQKFIQIGISGTSYALVTDNALTIIKNALYYIADITTGTTTVKLDQLTVKQSTTELSVNTNEEIPLTIFSTLGQRIKQSIGTSITINDLKPGVYFLQMDAKSGRQNYKFVK